VHGVIAFSAPAELHHHVVSDSSVVRAHLLTLQHNCVPEITSMKSRRYYVVLAVDLNHYRQA
jgi:hypothetical protein